MTGKKRLATTLGFLAPLIAVTTTIVWFRLANQVAIPVDRTLFIVFFLMGPVAGIAAFLLGTRWYGGVAAIPGIVCPEWQKPGSGDPGTSISVVSMGKLPVSPA